MEIEETKDFEIAEMEREYFESIEYLTSQALDKLETLKHSMYNKGMKKELEAVEWAIRYIEKVKSR